MAVQVSQAMSGALVQGDMVQKASPDEIKAALVEVTTPSTSLYSNLVQDNVEICSPALLTDGSETVLGSLSRPTVTPLVRLADKLDRPAAMGCSRSHPYGENRRAYCRSFRRTKDLRSPWELCGSSTHLWQSSSLRSWLLTLSESTEVCHRLHASPVSDMCDDEGIFKAQACCWSWIIPDPWMIFRPTLIAGIRQGACPVLSGWQAAIMAKTATHVHRSPMWTVMSGTEGRCDE